MRQLSFLLFLLFSINGFAAHIIGGIAQYSVQGINNAEGKTSLNVTFRMFRDALGGGAPLDINAEFGIFQMAEDGTYSYYDIADNISPENINEIMFSSSLEDYSVEAGDYNFTIELDHNFNYIIAFQRCCRNQFLQNVFESGETGIAIQIEIKKDALLNTQASPSLTGFPLSIVNKNSEIDFQLPVNKAIDTEIEFSFKSAFASGGTFDASTGDVGCCICIHPQPLICLPPFDNVPYYPPYTGEKPFSSMNPVAIDNSNGKMSGSIFEEGRFNYGVEIIQSLNGAILSRQILDYALLVVGPVSIDSEINTIPFTVYPNPSDGKILIKTESFKNAKDAYFEVYNSSGEKVVIQGIKFPSSDISMDLTVGIYIIRLVSKGKSLGIKKIIIH